MRAMVSAKRVLISISVCFISLALAFSADASQRLLIRNITVVDPIDGSARNRDVRIEAGRIVAIDEAGESAVTSAGGTDIDGTTLFLIPGLWDMHGHVSDEASGPLYVLNGVLGVRQMLGHDQSYAWRHRRLEATPAMPRMYLGSPLIDGAPAHYPGSIEVTNPDEAREAVRTVARSGAEFLKVYSKVPAAAYAALMDEAARLGVRVEGHVPDTVSWLSVASDGRQRSIEHLWGLPRWVASNAEDLTARTALFYEGVNWDSTLTPEQQARTVELQNEAYDRYDPVRFAAMVRDLARNRVWQSPTLVMWETRIREADPESAGDTRLAYLPAWMRDYWQAKVAADGNDAPAARALSERRHRFNLDRVREMHAAGVPILAGTDSPLPYVLPGWSLHEELELLVEAGLTPTEALRAATSSVGEFIGRVDVGRVREGALADLLIIEADPREDIRNTRRINTIIIAGQAIDAAAREEAFERLRRRAATPLVAEPMLEEYRRAGLLAATSTYDRLCAPPVEAWNCSPIDAIQYGLAPVVQESNALAHLADLVDWTERRFNEDVEIQAWVGSQHRRAGRHDRAQAAFERALKLAPGSPFLLHQIAQD